MSTIHPDNNIVNNVARTAAPRKSTEFNSNYTYWAHKGTYQAAADEVQKLVPVEGPVPNAKKAPALERFRRASNCYYDLYNNGLCNRASEFRGAFGFTAGQYKTRFGSGTGYSRALEARMEEVMDDIVVAAAREQGINTPDLPPRQFVATGTQVVDQDGVVAVSLVPDAAERDMAVELARVCADHLNDKATTLRAAIDSEELWRARYVGVAQDGTRVHLTVFRFSVSLTGVGEKPINMALIFGDAEQLRTTLLSIFKRTGVSASTKRLLMMAAIRGASGTHYDWYFTDEAVI